MIQLYRLTVRYKVGHIQKRVHCLTRGVKLGGSEGQEAIVDEGLSQVVLQVLKRALASHNSLHIHQSNINKHCLHLHHSSTNNNNKHICPSN